jgi:uncharacterized repeat protein (TIGR03803 family)
MLSPAERLISLFRTIVLVAVAALLITSAALPMPAQNTVPPTAVQAAKMPQFAQRLAHPAAQPASRPNPALARQASRIGPPQGGDIYANGPINGNTDAWAINFGFIVSDTFTLGNGTEGPVTGMSFGAWLFPGDTVTSVQLSISSEPNGGTFYFNQTVNLTQDNCAANLRGFDVCTENTTFTGPNLNAGTYWVNLQNASVPSGDPVYWDENSGVGCQSPGCPSQAEQQGVGTIPSESFTMLGSNGGPTCYGPQGNLQTLFDFTAQQGAGNGVAIDRAGNLYGTTPNGGNNSAGFAYKLAHHLSWLLDPLFSFLGGNTGGEPTGAIIGPNGSLYGGAQGGIQNCGSGGSQYCGLVYNLTPQATACRTSLCSWNENVPYRFSSDSDGSGVINLSTYDSQGNLYGTTSTGGADDFGTVFELTPSGGSWTKTILYSFTGANDGTNPTQILVGNDGNLYGIAGGGVFDGGVVFQLTSSNGQWTQSVIHAFGSEGDSSPAYLVQDGAGNLYGIAENISQLSGVIFAVLKTGSGWGFNQYLVKHNEFDVLNNLTIDTAGNLYGTGYDGSMFRGGRFKPPQDNSHDSYIFKASYANGSWNYQDLEYLSDEYLDSSGSLALDPSGNLYGTTYDCGTNSSGTVWQLSP